MNIYTSYYVPFKDDKNLNKRWDTRIYLFQEQVVNSNLFAIERISLKSNKNNMINKQQINEGK